MEIKKDIIIDKRRFMLLTVSLALLSVSCLILLVFRISLTGSHRYKFFIWNLFLAWIPYLFSIFLLITFNKTKSFLRIIFVLIMTFLWLLFYPNSSYIISDFIYLAKYPVQIFNYNTLATPSTILWYDILLVFSFAFTGHFIGLVSLFIFHKIYKVLFSKFYSWLFVFISVMLSGFGIYLGRFLRLNSWDLLLTPYETTMEITNSFFNLKAIFFAFTFSLFIFVNYLALYFFYTIRIYTTKTEVKKTAQ